MVARTRLGSAGRQELSHTLIMQEDFASFSRPLNGRTRTATFTDSTLDMAAEHCAQGARGLFGCRNESLPLRALLQVS